MLNKLLKVKLGELVFPMIESAIYLNSTNIGTTTFTTDTLYIVEEPINPSSAVEYTIPAGCVLHFNHGAYFGSNVTLRLNRTVIEAHLEKIFDGTRIIGLMKNDEIPVEWFGAVGDGLTDDSAAINACIKYSGNLTVLLGGPHYRVASTINFIDPNYEKETWNDGSGNYILNWPNDKRFISKGILVGDPSLGANPVLRINLVSTEIYLNHVKVLSTEENSSAVVIEQPVKKFYAYRISKVNDGQGQGVFLNSNEVPTTPSGYGVVITSYTNYSNIHIGSIFGFKYGFGVTEALSSYNTFRMGVNKIHIVAIAGCIYPVYINLTRSNSYFNGNYIEVQEFGGPGSIDKSLFTGSAVTIINTVGGSIGTNYIHDDYWEGWFTRFLDISGVKNLTVSGMFSVSDIISVGLTGKGQSFTAARNKTNHYTLYGLFKFENCKNVTINNMNKYIPYDMISTINCTDFKVNHTAPAFSMDSTGVLNKNAPIFDYAYITRMGGETTIESTDLGDTVTLLKPSIKLANRFVYISAMPASPDTSKLYCIPVTNMGIAKFEVKAYLNSAWRTIGYVTHNEFGNVYTL